MKVLFVGLGSIGQRHLRNLKAVVGGDIEILVYRNTNHNLVIEQGQAFECGSLKAFYGYEEVLSLEEGLAQKPEIVFITNPSSKHLDVALVSAKAKVNMFIEKPLSHDSNRTDELQSFVKKNKLVVCVGYQTRYHPCFKAAQSIVAQAQYGKVISGSFEWGTYLPDHHPYEDYRNGYAANSSLGGGVTLGLIHEIDLIYNFFGVPKTIAAIGGNLSSLEMTAEDTVSALLGFESDGGLIPVSLFLSYAQKYEKRTFSMQFENALLVCDLIANSLIVYGSNEEVMFKKEFGDLDRNEMFKDEMKEFIDCVKAGDIERNSLTQGVETLAIALRIKEAINEIVT